MPSFSVEVDVEVLCGSCNDGICGNAEHRTSNRRGRDQFVIDPCQRCLDRARQEGRDEAEAEFRKAEDNQR